MTRTSRQQRTYGHRHVTDTFVVMLVHTRRRHARPPPQPLAAQVAGSAPSHGEKLARRQGPGSPTPVGGGLYSEPGTGQGTGQRKGQGPTAKTARYGLTLWDWPAQRMRLVRFHRRSRCRGSRVPLDVSLPRQITPSLWQESHQRGRRRLPLQRGLLATRWSCEHK